MDLKAHVRAADAVLFATPEYNYSVPGVLKNAIDWGIAPAWRQCLGREGRGHHGRRDGAIGTARAQYHLRQTFVFLDMHAVNKPEVMIGTRGRSSTRRGT